MRFITEFEERFEPVPNFMTWAIIDRKEKYWLSIGMSEKDAKHVAFVLNQFEKSKSINHEICN